MAKKKVTIDEGLCLGCGICASICPEGFAINDEDFKSHFIGNAEEISDEILAEAQESCPEQAITLEEVAEEEEKEEKAEGIWE